MPEDTVHLCWPLPACPPPNVFVSCLPATQGSRCNSASEALAVVPHALRHRASLESPAAHLVSSTWRHTLASSACTVALCSVHWDTARAWRWRANLRTVARGQCQPAWEIKACNFICAIVVGLSIFAHLSAPFASNLRADSSTSPPTPSCSRAPTTRRGLFLGLGARVSKP